LLVNISMKKFSKLLPMAETTDLLCSRCEKPLDTGGSPRWCKACRAAYQREYQILQSDIAKGKGFSAGAEAMRGTLIDKLRYLNPGVMTTLAEVAKWIRECPAPRS
jgi:hypothetical protein